MVPIFHTFGFFPWLLNVGKLLLGSETNLCYEVNFVNRHVVALKMGVLPPPIACDYELSVNVGIIGKLYKRHRLPVFRARQRISPFLFHSLFGVRGGRCAKIKIRQSILFRANTTKEWQVAGAGGDAEELQVDFDLLSLYVLNLNRSKIK